MRARAELEVWPLRAPFGISRGVSRESYVLHVTLESDGVCGHGEAEAAEFDQVEAEQTRRACDAFLADWNGRPSRGSRATLQYDLAAGPIRNAIDCALWDLEAKQRGRRAWEIAGIAPAPIRTLFTIALDTPSAMAAVAAAHQHWPWLKVKLGGANDLARVAAVHAAAPHARLLVDANGGWTRAELDAYAPTLASLGVALIEQPLAPGTDAELADWRGPLPLCADESITDCSSLQSLSSGYRAINIKLDKTGGLTEALALADEARARGLDVMVGCNLGTSLAMAPALLLAHRATIVDLDGPLLLARDREPSLVYHDGEIGWPERALWG